MWRIEESEKGNKYGKGIIALITILTFIFSAIVFVSFMIDTMKGIYSLEDGFYRCMAVIGILFVLCSILGHILTYVEYR